MQFMINISYDYLNPMNRSFLLKSIILVLLFWFLLPGLNKSFAVEPPAVDISPSGPLYPYQPFTVNVTQCSTGAQMHIELFEDGAYTAFEGEWVTRNPDGSASVNFGGLREIRSYTVKVNCGGEIFSYVSKITVQEFTGTITLSHEQTQPNSARVTAQGCPPNSETKFEYKLFPAVIFSTFNDSSDANGVSSFSLNAAGDYVVKINCGGITSAEYAFTITEDGSQGAVFPTLPDPPEPPCGNFVEGKCIEVETPLGKIKTDGAGILYTLFVLILSLSGGILVITIMYAGYQLMMSRGNPEQIQKARELLTSAIIGFLFILFSYVILGVLTDDILNLPGFMTETCLPNDPSCIGP